MKISHRVPLFETPSAVLDEAYQREVDRATRKAERSYEAALKALQRAETKLERAKAQRNTKVVRVAREIVELRRQELEDIAAQMQGAPATASHRGVRSYQPVPRTPGRVF